MGYPWALLRRAVICVPLGKATAPDRWASVPGARVTPPAVLEVVAGPRTRPFMLVRCTPLCKSSPY